MPEHQRPIPVSRGPQPESSSPQGRLESSVIVQTPPIDIYEAADGLILEADLPGAAEDAVAIHLEDSILTLRAEARRNLPDDAEPLHEEFPFARYQRTFILNDEVDRSKISAVLRNGVLRLTLPRAERAKTRRIEISSDDTQ